MADLILENISKSFGEVKALIDVNFSANCGEIHAILGENGAGKSTLVKILSRAIKEDSGSIKLFGRQLFLKTPNDAINEGISTVYQDLSLIPVLTVAENIYFNKSPQNYWKVNSKKILNSKMLDIFEKFGVSGIKPNTIVEELSSSEKQVVEIIKALYRDPKVLILDEPTSSLTADKVEWLLKLIKNLAEKGKIVIFISHRMPEVKAIANIVTVFRNGMNISTMKMSETNSDELVSLMLGRGKIDFFPNKESFIKEEKVILETRNLNIGNVLRNINFKLHVGEILGVGGLVGQGQIPLFLSLFGIIKAKGQIFIDGHEKNIKNPKDALDNGMALIPEDRNIEGLIMSMTIRENITMPILKKIKSYGLINYKKEKSIVLNYINMLKIKATSMESLVSTLSGGNQQKVLIAKLLSIDPKIFLMYDLTKGVDIGTKVEIFNLIKKLANEGKGIIYYSTTIDELVNICDKVMVMRDGEIVEILDGKNLNKENILKASIGEKIISITS